MISIEEKKSRTYFCCYMLGRLLIWIALAEARAVKTKRGRLYDVCSLSNLSIYAIAASISNATKISGLLAFGTSVGKG